jgi:hypothetical protein
MPDDVVFLLNTYSPEPTQVTAHKPATMHHCLKRRGGIIAVLGSNIWTATKATSNTLIRVNNAMIRASFHWRLLIHRKVKMMDGRAHSIRLATPLKCQHKTDHTRYQECSAKNIKLPQLLHPGEFGCISVGDLETEGNGDHRHSTDGQIDIKAPPPSYMCGKGTTN